MDTQQTRAGVYQAFTAVAQAPESEHPFPVGRDFAERLGYPAHVLDNLPPVSVAAFAGVSNVSVFADIPAGAVVLDLGCGAGTDSLIAGQTTGPDGSVIGLDFSEAMLARARQAADEAGMPHVEFRPGDAERLPLADGSVDVVLVNGLFNLNPERDRIFAEIARVLRQGGAVYAAELIVREPLPESERQDLTNWFA